MKAYILNEQMQSVREFNDVTDSDFDDIEAITKNMPGKHCIKWSRAADGQNGYWSPSGAIFNPHWYSPSGRPATLDDGKRVNVYLDSESLTRASELGNGNVSEGIRIALKSAFPEHHGKLE